MFKFHKTVQRFRAKKLKYWNSTSKGGGEGGRRATTVDNSMVCGYFASGKSTSKKTFPPYSVFLFIVVVFFFSHANETKEVNLSNSKKFYIIANYKRSCA